MDFNSNLPNLLAIGGSEVLIVNTELALASQEGNKSQYVYSPQESRQEEVGHTSEVKWSSESPQVLASSSKAGVASVWDLRQTKRVFQFTGGAEYCTSWIWNAQNSTQLVMGYDNNPFIQTWDLRNLSAPARSLSTTGGTRSLEFSPSDPSILLSISACGVATVWDYISEKIIRQKYHQLESHAREARWLRWSHGAYSVVSEVGNLRIHWMYPQHDSEEQNACNRGFEVDSKHIPSWLVTPCGGAFGFGNKFVAFSGVRSSISTVKIEVPSDSWDFDDLYKNRDIQTIWKVKQDGIQDKQEKMQWKIIAALSSHNPQNELLRLLKYDVNAIAAATDSFTGQSQDTNDITFQQLETKTSEDLLSDDLNSQKVPLKMESLENEQIETITRNKNWFCGGERLIRDNLVLNNLHGAVRWAMQAQRPEIALILAAKLGPTFFQQIQNDILKSTTENTPAESIQVLLNNDIDSMIAHNNPKKWKETLATVLIHGNWSSYCSALGDHLVQSNEHAALICYMVGQNLNAVFNILIGQYHKKKETFSDDEKFHELKNLAEKLLVYKLIVAKYIPNENFDNIMVQYIDELIKRGHIESAKCVIKETGVQDPFADRLFHSYDEVALSNVKQEPQNSAKYSNDIELNWNTEKQTPDYTNNVPVWLSPPISPKQDLYKNYESIDPSQLLSPTSQSFIFTSMIDPELTVWAEWLSQCSQLTSK